jgi:hypothetical protein
MKKPFLKSISAVILFLFIIGCDSGYKNCPDHYFSDTYKSYTVFNEGSYWIYKDTLYGVTDSMNLIFQGISFDSDCSYHGEPEEELIQHFTSSFFNNDGAYSIIYGYAELAWYNDNTQTPTAFYADHLTNYDIDSMLINNVWYKDLKVIKNGDYEAYWAKNVGLIKKLIPISSDTVYNFELVRYMLN